MALRPHSRRSRQGSGSHRWLPPEHHGPVWTLGPLGLPLPLAKPVVRHERASDVRSAALRRPHHQRIRRSQASPGPRDRRAPRLHRLGPGIHAGQTSSRTDRLPATGRRSSRPFQLRRAPSATCAGDRSRVAPDSATYRPVGMGCRSTRTIHLHDGHELDELQ